MQDNEDFDLRSRFFLRIGGKVLRNPDSLYQFIRIICSETSITELAIIEAIFSDTITTINNDN